MSIIGRTSGGWPITFSAPRHFQPRTRNQRFACAACPNRTTRRQLLRNGFVCFACKAPLRPEALEREAKAMLGVMA